MSDRFFVFCTEVAFITLPVHWNTTEAAWDDVSRPSAFFIISVMTTTTTTTTTTPPPPVTTTAATAAALHSLMHGSVHIPKIRSVE
jgi:hypothetical protein